MKVEQRKIGDVDSTAALVQIGMNELYRRVIGRGIRDFASLPSFASFRWIACDFCVIAKYVCVMVSLFASSAQCLSAPLYVSLHRSRGRHDGHDANDANDEQPSPAQFCVYDHVKSINRKLWDHVLIRHHENYSLG